MNASLEIGAAGAYASLQDLGRFGLRRIGVPWSGALDPRLLRIANRLAGNPEATVAIECFEGGQRFCAHDAAITLAVAGDAQLQLTSAGETHRVASWRSFHLAPGDRLTLRSTGRGRLAYVAAAGLSTPTALGSASTYVRALLGGLRGAALAVGDRMQVSATAAGLLNYLDPPSDHEGPIRVVAGPQHDYFDPSQIKLFTTQSYTVSAASDRMGMRLAGQQALQHRPEMGAEIISDATVPGVIQVPGNGQPIVLLADGQTAGGYPKIATVISADRARLAASRPGDRVRFTLVTVAEAEAGARTAAVDLQALLARIRPLSDRGFNLDALYRGNLVDGMVNALQPDHIP